MWKEKERAHRKVRKNEESGASAPSLNAQAGPPLLAPTRPGRRPVPLRRKLARKSFPRECGGGHARSQRRRSGSWNHMRFFSRRRTLSRRPHSPLTGPFLFRRVNQRVQTRFGWRRSTQERGPGGALGPSPEMLSDARSPHSSLSAFSAPLARAIPVLEGRRAHPPCTGKHPPRLPVEGQGGRPLGEGLDQARTF